MSRESDLEARIKKLEARKNFLARQVNELSRQVKPLLSLDETVELLQAQELPIEVIPIYGAVIGDVGSENEDGPDSRTIIFGNGAPFARYVSKVGGKTVLRGKIIYKRDSHNESDSWDFATCICNDGLAFMEQPHIQAYFIPTYLQDIKEEEGEEDEDDE